MIANTFVTLQGKGMMNTYWLTGLSFEEEDVCMESMHLDPLIKPEDRHDDDVTDGGSKNAAGKMLEISAGNTNTGKVSIADSGIYMDKSSDEKMEDKNTGNKEEGQSIDDQIYNRTDYQNIILHTTDRKLRTKSLDRYVEEPKSSEFDSDGSEDVVIGRDRAMSERNGIRSYKKYFERHTEDFSNNYPLTKFFCESFNKRETKSADESDHSHDSKKNKKRDKKKSKKKKNKVLTKSHSMPDSDYSPKEKILKLIKSKPSAKEHKVTYKEELVDQISDDEHQITKVKNGFLGKGYNMYYLDNVSEISADDDLTDKSDYTFIKGSPSRRFTPPPRLNSTDYMTIHNTWFEGYKIK